MKRSSRQLAACTALTGCVALAWVVARFVGLVPPPRSAQPNPTRSADDRALISALRLLAASQENHHLRYGVYAARTADLDSIPSRREVSIQITNAAPSGWAASATLQNGRRCSMR